MSVLAEVRRYIQTHRLFPAGTHLVLGVSGGPDSLCLLDVLTGLSGAWHLTLTVACLNHGLRTAAANETERVRTEAAARGWGFATEEADSRAYAAREKLSLEEAARVLRYGFLARVAQSVGAGVIAVAHTADDQAETVLMHFLRGSGLAGLRGMLPLTKMRDWRVALNLQSPISNLSLVRPLLATTRAEVEAYCAEHGLRPWTDASNADTTFYRNRLRHELLPALETYNPSIRAVLSRTADVLAGEYEIVEQALGADWAALARADSEHVSFDLKEWRALTVPRQRALLRRAIAHLRAHLRDVDFAPIEAAVRFSQVAQSSRACDVTAGLCCAVEAERLVLRDWDYAHATPDDLPLLASGGALRSGWHFVVAQMGALPADVNAATGSWHEYVDADALAEPLRLRVPQPGDRFQPLGLAGNSAKLSDFFINRKVAARLRGRWPLVMCGETVVWVAGLRLDERYKVTAATQRVVKLEFRRSTPAD